MPKFALFSLKAFFHYDRFIMSFFLNDRSILIFDKHFDIIKVMIFYDMISNTYKLRSEVMKFKEAK